MKRIIVFCIVLLLLAGCGGKESTAPQVQLDARVEATATPAPTSVPVTAAPVTITAVPQVVTAAPEITAEPAPTVAPTPEPVPQEAGPVEALVARWEAEGLLGGLYPMEAMDALDLYGIDFDACRGGAAFGDADGYTNEAVVVEGDKAVLDQVEAMLQNHLEAVKAQFKGYDPDALALAEKAVLVREGDMLLFVISPDADAMLAAFRAK